MIYKNQRHDTLAEMPHATTPATNAADILRIIEPATALRLEPLIPLATLIPALSGNILELHFGNNSIDFATRLNINFDKALIERIKDNYYNLPFVQDNFLTLIRQQENGFDYGIENIWIEYDAPFDSAPALFFDINRNDIFKPETVCSNLQHITDIFGCSITAKLPEFFKQVQQARLHVVYYGFMFSRDARSIRLTINGIEADQLIPTLKSLGWKGNYALLKKLAPTYLKNGQKLVIGVDFGDYVENRIGIEVFDEDHDAFIQLLYNDQHINKAQLEMLDAWQQRVKLPEHLAADLTQLYQRQVHNLYTRINHFKFVIDQTDEIAVKGYLYYCF